MDRPLRLRTKFAANEVCSEEISSGRPGYVKPKAQEDAGTGHCLPEKKVPLNVNDVTRHKKAVYSTDECVVFFSATGETRWSVAIQTFHAVNYRQKRTDVKSKTDIIFGNL